MTIPQLLTLFSNDYLLMFVAIVVYISKPDKKYAHLIILLLFAMIYKSLLKEILKIPAPDTSPTRYGFPSGHINFAAMFFGWFMINYRNKLTYCIGGISLILAAISTVYLGYHRVIDVIVTPILPISILYIYNKYMKDIEYEKFLYIFVTVSTILKIISYIKFKEIPIDVYIGSYGILGFGILTLFKNKKSSLATIAIILLYYTMSNGHFYKNSIWLIVFATVAIVKHYKNEKIE